ncbi:hypothetical protein H3Z83_02035 [Tenacibaculum sp. S7007]|uniref:Uncharacterized protein n=1 Tax=Tenacibaculum pelagium TaxID=2759527 RepID=A0A839ALP0_9FLAO|nr:hypothetical protein [Tenacibaculum pelagium]MBA6155308.1 hypothetical protein [Tenacibaculum pelagium]
MPKNIKHIKLLILTFALVLLNTSTNAQEVRVIDNKGTIQTVKSNTVNTSITESTPADYIANVDATYSPIENDTYIYTPANGEKVYYVYDGVNWNMIAPTKAARVFYPPSIAIDASSISADPTIPSSGDESIDLYNDYYRQFRLEANLLPTPGKSAQSTGSPNIVPYYERNELYYYVTYYDPSVIENVSIDADGNMSYDIISTPTDDNTIINVVFVVK